jgi:hypothetical protein
MNLVIGTVLVPSALASQMVSVVPAAFEQSRAFADSKRIVVAEVCEVTHPTLGGGGGGGAGEGAGEGAGVAELPPPQPESNIKKAIVRLARNWRIVKCSL